jgi:hypothetical protein
MNPLQSKLLMAVILACIIIISAVCWHSVGEIHYLKSFFPHQFTVEETYYAARIEIIKIAIISLPLILIIGTCLYLLRYIRNDAR